MITWSVLESLECFAAQVSWCCNKWQLDLEASLCEEKGRASLVLGLLTQDGSQTTSTSVIE